MKYNSALTTLEAGFEEAAAGYRVFQRLRLLRNRQGHNLEGM